MGAFALSHGGNGSLENFDPWVFFLPSQVGKDGFCSFKS